MLLRNEDLLCFYIFLRNISDNEMNVCYVQTGTNNILAL